MTTSDTASQLRTRIGDLSSSIDNQRQLLKDLEKQKSDAQGQLNALLDPMGRLPVEVSAEIFIECLPSTPTMDPDQAPAVFTEVCRAWRKLAISIPSLWTRLTDKDVAPRKFDRFFSTWALRVKRLPISLRLVQSLPHLLDGGMLGIYAHKIQKLELHPARLEVLMRMAFRFVGLTSLTVARNMLGDAAFMPFFNAKPCIELLRCAPNLVECTFVSFTFMDEIHADAAGASVPLTHTALKHLRLGHDSRSCTAVFLQYLTLPVLETLWISSLDIDHQDMVTFLTRSAPPLRSLYLSADYYGDGQVEQYLRLAPNLTDLTIRLVDESAVSLLQLFRDGRNLLPNLPSLTVRAEFVEMEDYTIVADILRNRSASLRFFSLILDDPEIITSVPPADALREAIVSHRQRGMEIRIRAADSEDLAF
ncbi:hypothetical protein FB45DRAFT_47326 [Roridomyces roridus]|uniref:F-box domain-containing protein n=1 Tax=Roridomyces roridus TaxID=1738132 RepID=A0AAD7BS52_9AGAR|nr:hypothetical protein FB45DRAFT_47326 [Roridomyces roridus]